MIVDQSGCLHKRVADGWTDKRKTPCFQVFAHRLGFFCKCGNLLFRAPSIANSSTVYKLPDIFIERRVAVHDAKISPGVFYGGFHFQSISDNSGVGEEFVNFFRTVPGYFFSIEIIECSAIVFPAFSIWSTNLNRLARRPE